MGNNGGGPIPRNVNNRMFPTCVIHPDNFKVLSWRDVEVSDVEEDHIINSVAQLI